LEGDKDGQCKGLTTLPPSCANCLDVLGPSWTPKGMSRPIMGYLLPKYFTLQTFPDLLNVKFRHFAFPFFQSCAKALCYKIYILCYLYVLTLQSPDRNGNPGCGPDRHWSITVEQFVATLLTSQPIVEFFGRQTLLSEVIMKMRGRRFNRLHSLSDTAFVKV